MRHVLRAAGLLILAAGCQSAPSGPTAGDTVAAVLEVIEPFKAGGTGRVNLNLELSGPNRPRPRLLIGDDVAEPLDIRAAVTFFQGDRPLTPGFEAAFEMDC